VVGALLAFGCGPATEDPCVETAWSLRIDDDRVSRVSQLCEIQVAPDGTIVLLAAVQPGLAFIEIDPSGTSWRRVDLPVPDLDEVVQSGCRSLVFTPDGEWWAAAAFKTLGGFESYILRAPVHGEASLSPSLMTNPPWLVVDGAIVRAAGASKAPSDDMDDEWSALLGLIDPRTSTWAIEHRYPGLAGVHGLVSAPQRVYALMNEPSIDFAPVHLFAIDPTSGNVAWQRPAGSVGAVVPPHIIGLETTDVVVAKQSSRSTTLERIDAAGRTVWEHEHEYASAVASHAVVATHRELVSIDELGHIDDLDPSVVTYATHAEVVGFDGQQVCTAVLEEPRAEWSPRLVTASPERVLMASRDPMGSGIVVTSLTVPERP
jgi:hypothetical protein